MENSRLKISYLSLFLLILILILCNTINVVEQISVVVQVKKGCVYPTELTCLFRMALLRNSMELNQESRF